MMEEQEAVQRVAVVTGAAQGIGKAIATAFALRRVHLVIADAQTKKLKQTVKELRKLHGNVIGIRCDVRKKSDVERLFKMTVQKMKRIDFVINNAGIAVNKLLTETTEKEWENIIQTNLNGIFYCCKEVVPVMIKQKSGVIINISSRFGKHGMKGFTAYSASKFGVIGLTESLADELKESNVKVYSIYPHCGVNTEMHKNLFPSTQTEKLLKPELIAQRVIQLCYENYLVKTGASVEV